MGVWLCLVENSVRLLLTIQYILAVVQVLQTANVMVSKYGKYWYGKLMLQYIFYMKKNRSSYMQPNLTPTN